MPTAQLPAHNGPLSPSKDSCYLLNEAQRYLLTADKRFGIDPQLESAWQQFHEQYSDKIRKFAFRCGATQQEINDCVQDVWAELLVRLPSFQLDPTRGQFDTWLFQIVRSKTANQLRIRKRIQAFKDVDGIGSLSDGRSSVPRSLEDAEIFRVASAELKQRLSERNYRILQMRLVVTQKGTQFNQTEYLIKLYPLWTALLTADRSSRLRRCESPRQSGRRVRRRVDRFGNRSK